MDVNVDGRWLTQQETLLGWAEWQEETDGKNRCWTQSVQEEEESEVAEEEENDIEVCAGSDESDNDDISV